MSASLVGSEMCIRDRPAGHWSWPVRAPEPRPEPASTSRHPCTPYASAARADGPAHSAASTRARHRGE
eukprot:14302881-Alexandrium_andersonii.AAC.1